MVIDCQSNPDELIDKIGDRNFVLCDESLDHYMRHPHHPKVIRIMDCESGVHIDVWTEHGNEDTLESARALVQLLNQNYFMWHK